MRSLLSPILLLLPLLLTQINTFTFIPTTSTLTPTLISNRLSSSSSSASIKSNHRTSNYPTFTTKLNAEGTSSSSQQSEKPPPSSSSSSETQTSEISETSHNFDANISRVMSIIVSSLYSHRSVFLRELISNASDACDKVRLMRLRSKSSTVSGSGVVDDDVELGVKISISKEKRTVTIEDTGIGMSRSEVIENLGRIAQSGTQKFQDALASSGSGEGDGSEESEEAKKNNLIGQFGVGFYSSFLVSQDVTFETSSFSSPNAWTKWQSSGSDQYKLTALPEKPLGFEGTHGSRLTLSLRDDASEYLDFDKVKDLAEKYSEFINVPVRFYEEVTTYKKGNASDEKEQAKPIKENVWTQLNKSKPIWLKAPKDVTDAEYVKFYQTAFKCNYDTPLAWSHFKLEGSVEAKCLVYIPGFLPHELSKDMFDTNSKNIKLYVKRVFINDSFQENIMPRYMKFIRGIVDSDDLPLNVGREIIQKSKGLNVISRRLVRKGLDMIKEIKNKKEDNKYPLFWKNFGKYVKVGVIEDSENAKELASYCRFSTSKSNNLSTLETYISNMKSSQKKILTVSGDGLKACKMNPIAESLISRGYEVIYLTETLDEIVFQSLEAYGGFDVVDVNKGDFSLDESEDEIAENSKNDDKDGKTAKKVKPLTSDQLEPLTTILTDLLSKQVTIVQVSKTLTTPKSQPSALVQGDYGISPSMKRYMVAQAVQIAEEQKKTKLDAQGEEIDQGKIESMISNVGKPVLEINPSHPLIKGMVKLLSEGATDTKKLDKLKDLGLLVCDLASLMGGYDVEDMKGFGGRVLEVMGGGGVSVEVEEEDDVMVSEAEVVG